MNKIRVVNDNVLFLESDDHVEVKLSNKLDVFDVLKINMKVKEDTEIEIQYESKKEFKMDMLFEVEKQVKVQIKEIHKSDQLKIQYQYQLQENSDLKIYKFGDTKETKELDIIHLNGEYANIDYIFHTIATQKQKYDMVIYHNSKNTKSLIQNHGVTLEEGEITFHITSVVYPNISGCILEQNNRIINLNQKKCTIDPVLLIEENDVVASHSAYIGSFKKAEIFYCMSRGISEKKAIQMLTKGFLLHSFEQNKEVERMIDSHWR